MNEQGKNSKDRVKVLVIGHANGGKTKLINEISKLLSEERTSELVENSVLDKPSEKKVEEKQEETDIRFDKK